MGEGWWWYASMSSSDLWLLSLWKWFKNKNLDEGLDGSCIFHYKLCIKLT